MFKFFEGAEFGDANFSAVLPDGWGAVDTLTEPLFNLDDPPSGILAKLGEPGFQVFYSITPPEATGGSWVRPGYVRQQSIVDGVTVDWTVPIGPMDTEKTNLHIEATFPSMPGDSEHQFGLNLTAYGLNASFFSEVKQIIESVRYANPPRLLQVPGPQVKPGLDWQRVAARWDGGSTRFSVLAPPGTTFKPRKGLDTLLGTFNIGEIEIFFDYGSASSSPTNPDGHIRFTDSAEQQFWVEVIDGKPFTFYRPAKEIPSGTAYTGITVARIPGLPDIVINGGSYSSIILSCGGSFFALDVDRDEQELVLAVLRTIRAESQPPDCK